MDTVHKNHDLVKELVDLTQKYRKNVLFIPKTYFYNPICSFIQCLMDSRSAGIVEILPDTVDVEDLRGSQNLLGIVSLKEGGDSDPSFDDINGLKSPPKPPLSAGASSYLSAMQEDDIHPASSNKWWNSRDPVSSLDQACTDLLPPRHYWRCQIFQFTDNDTKEIFEQLGREGVYNACIYSCSCVWDFRYCLTWNRDGIGSGNSFAPFWNVFCSSGCRPHYRHSLSHHPLPQKDLSLEDFQKRVCFIRP